MNRADETAATAVAAALPDAQSSPVAAVGRVPQGFDHKVSFRLVPGREGSLITHSLGCQPRHRGVRPEGNAAMLPPDLIGKLLAANEHVTSWLAQDSGNAQHFLEHPVEALVKAGVELTRADQKALARAHAAARDAATIPPGVRLVSLSASADATGVVDEHTTHSGGTSTHSQGCGCGS